MPMIDRATWLAGLADGCVVSVRGYTFVVSDSSTKSVRFGPHRADRKTGRITSGPFKGSLIEPPPPHPTGR